MSLFGPSRFSRQYGKELQGLSGTELTAELDKMVTVLSTEALSVSDYDRAGYLLFESLPRISEQADQRRFVAGYLKKNRHPAHGVQDRLDQWLEEVTPENAEWLVGQLLQDSIEKAVKWQGTWQEIKEADEDFVIRVCVDQAIKHRLKSMLVLVRTSPVLRHGNGMLLECVIAAANILDDMSWKEEFLQRLVRGMRKEHHADYNRKNTALVEQAFELTKQEQFSAYGQQLFDVIINTTLRVFSHQAGWLRLLAEVAVNHNQSAWQDTVYQKAKGYLRSEVDRYNAYQAIKVLAPVHEAARQTIATTPEPEYRMFLS